MQKHIKNIEKERDIYIKNIQKVHMYKHRRNHPQLSRAQGGIISTTTLVCHFVVLLVYHFCPSGKRKVSNAYNALCFVPYLRAYKINKN